MGAALTKAARAKKTTTYLASILEATWVVKKIHMSGCEAPGLRTKRLV